MQKSPAMTMQGGAQLKPATGYKYPQYYGHQRTKKASDQDNSTLLDQYCSVRTVDKKIEVPEVQLLERVVTVVHKVQKEKVVTVPKVEIVKKVVQVPKVVYEEQEVPVVQYQYKEVPVEKIVEMIEYQYDHVYHEIPVDEEVPVSVVHPAQAPVEQDITRNVPVLVDLITTHGYEMPKIKPIYTTVNVPVYVPRYIEVPVAAQLLASAPDAPHKTTAINLRKFSDTAMPHNNMDRMAFQRPGSQVECP